MMRVRMRRAVSVVAITVAALTATACSSPSSSDSSALPPVMADISEVNGTTVELPLDQTLVITGDDQTYTTWDADISDPDIVTFTKGRDDGSAQFNPGFEPKTQGQTEVTMNNSESGDSVTFTVKVTPGAS
ncbi:hypothetical protein WDJ51_10865 [Rathayibacter sp. YIM 133350]|uniref:hypothetical protein n=1 Tax=Rathayibacter sp. YIM 133350 TaxID=3131992 RepID=UPI00307DA250